MQILHAEALDVCLTRASLPLASFCLSIRPLPCRAQVTRQERKQTHNMVFTKADCSFPRTKESEHLMLDESWLDDE